MKPKLISLESWRKKVSKLEKKYSSLKKLEEDIVKYLKTDYLIYKHPELKMIVVYPSGVKEYGVDDERIHLMRDAKFFIIRAKYLRMLDTDKMIDELVERLKDKISVDRLLRDALYDSNPQDLKAMFDRVVIKEAKVREKDCCYKLIIGGMKGRPFEFNLR